MGNRDPRSWNWQTGTRWYSSFSCPATDGRWLAGDEAILVVIHPDVSPGKPQPGRMEAQRGNCAEFIRVTRPCTRCTVRAPLKPHNVNSNANPSKTTIWRRQTVELRTVWNRSQQNRTDHHPISSYIILFGDLDLIPFVFSPWHLPGRVQRHLPRGWPSGAFQEAAADAGGGAAQGQGE